MKTAIVYQSVTGNTALVAKAVRQAVGEAAPVYFGAPGDTPDAELLFVGSWTDKGACAPEIASFLKELHGKKLAYFATAGFGGSQAYYDALFERIRALIPRGNEILPPFFCQGRMPPGVRARYVQLLSAHPGDEKIQLSIDNFDSAQSHPDASDLAAAKAWAEGLVR